MPTDFMESVYRERGRDVIVRMCLAGRGSWSELFKAMHKSGFIPNDKGGWPLRAYIQPMLDDGQIVRLSRGLYVATCPSCHEPIMNVAGMEH